MFVFLLFILFLFVLLIFVEVAVLIMRFEAHQELNLLALRDALMSRSYEPGRSVCFFVRRPKLREVFAADFTDRIVHHVLVAHLEKTWEKIFVHDSQDLRVRSFNIT